MKITWTAGGWTYTTDGTPDPEGDILIDALSSSGQSDMWVFVNEKVLRAMLGMLKGELDLDLS